MLISVLKLSTAFVGDSFTRQPHAKIGCRAEKQGGFVFEDILTPDESTNGDKAERLPPNTKRLTGS